MWPFAKQELETDAAIARIKEMSDGGRVPQPVEPPRPFVKKLLDKFDAGEYDVVVPVYISQFSPSETLRIRIDVPNEIKVYPRPWSYNGVSWGWTQRIHLELDSVSVDLTESEKVEFISHWEQKKKKENEARLELMEETRRAAIKRVEALP